MGKQFKQIEPIHREFILQQQIFFHASAAPHGRVNVSPKDRASLRILDSNSVIYLNMTGSGNETAAHLRTNGRLTLMFCALSGPPMILRLYGRARVLARHSNAYISLLASAFEGIEPPGARQMMMLEIDLVQTSCGYNVPLFDYAGERSTLRQWTESKGKAGLEQYWQEKNVTSIDGLPTGLLEPVTQ